MRQMRHFNTILKRAGRHLVLALTTCMVALLPFSPVLADPISDLENQIAGMSGQKDGIERQIAEYEGQIRQKQKEAATLASQLSIIEDSIRQTELKIQQNKIDIESTRLKLQQLHLRIEKTKKQIADAKDQLAELIRILYRYDQHSLVEIFLSNDTLSEFLDETHSIETVQKESQKKLKDIQRLKGELEAQLLDLEKQKADLEQLEKDLEFKHKELEGSKIEKEEFIAATKGQEEEYQKLLNEKKAATASINQQILALQREIDEIRSNGGGGGTNYRGEWTWPIAQGYGWVITCVFHCANYFPGLVHTGLDVAAYVTAAPIVNATTGTVMHAGWLGCYGNAVVVSSGEYMLIYGHMSSVSVSKGAHVTPGMQLGRQGTTGCSTGPHLHFEVRKNGTPINPMQFY